MKGFFGKNTVVKFCVYGSFYCITVFIIASLFIFAPNDPREFPLLRACIIFFASTLLIKYCAYMIISPWYQVHLAYNTYKNRKKVRGHVAPYNPFVSVLIPSWNEEFGIITTVEALLKSSYKNMELIVINNASTDNTTKKMYTLMSKYGNFRKKNPESPHIQLSYCTQNAQGKGHALNKGLERAKGEIIISIDADCYVPEKSIEKFVEHFRDPTVMAAVGNVKIGNTDTLIGVIQYLEFLFSFYFKKGDSLINSIYIIGGAAGAFRKEVFDITGNYNPTNITEDIDLSMLIQDAGMKIVYAEDALIYTEGANTIGGLIKQRLRWKRGRFQTFINRRNLFFSSQRKHPKILSWVILPYAVFGDLQLFLEFFFLIFLYIYSYITKDFSSFISGMLLISIMFFIQVLFEDHKKNWFKFILLAPIGWILFYIVTFVEFSALIKALWVHINKKEVVWQKWERSGVFSK